MIIGIDGNEANVAHPVGVSVYTQNLLAYFKRNSSDENRFIVYLRKPPGPSLPLEDDFYSYKVVEGKWMWSQLFLPLHLWLYRLSGKRLDVFFSPAHYIPRFSPFRSVVTIHDLSYLYFPHEFLKKDLYQLRNWTAYALSRSRKVIAVSKTTKKDIIKEYGLPEQRISVIYNGYQKEVVDENGPTEKKPYPYFLYVGTIQPRKNLSTLIRAFSRFHERHPEYKLIIAGKKGWLFEDIFKLVTQLHLSECIILPGFVTDTEKMYLYKHAKAFVLPSLYEGFGIPLLEAMSHKCPVISSYSSSLPEIGEEACLYFDPTSVVDLEEKMELLHSDPALTKDLIMRGTKRIAAFSWETAGRQTLEVLREVGNE